MRGEKPRLHRLFAYTTQPHAPQPPPHSSAAAFVNMASLFQQRHAHFATPMSIEPPPTQQHMVATTSGFGSAPVGVQQQQQQQQRMMVIDRPAGGAANAAGGAGGGVKRLTTKYGSKYEKARLLGEWATRVSHGSNPCVDLSRLSAKERKKYTDPLALAQKALADKTMPLGVRRFLEDGSHEDWFLDELVFLL